MKLRQFTVREFRSIWDSGPIKVDDQTTCLVGKNEAEKTALLTALYRTNPIIAGDTVFDETYDYPKREVEDYRFAVENKDREKAVVVECLYELFSAKTLPPFSLEISKIDQSMPIVVETEQISNRRNSLPKSRAEFSDGSSGGL